MPKEWRAGLEITGQALLVVAAPWLSYTNAFTVHHLRVVCVLPLVWLAYRWGLRGALVGAGAVALVSLARILFTPDHLIATGFDDFVLFQTVVIGLAVLLGYLLDRSKGIREGELSVRSEMEERLRDREQSFRLLFETNPLPMWVYDRETLRILAVNESATARYGFTHEEFLQMRYGDLQVSDPIARAIESITGRPKAEGELRHRLKNGTVIDVEVSVNRLEFGDRPGALVLVQDITDRKLLQEARRQATKESLDRLGRAAEYRDDETYEHTQRVGRMVRAICGKMEIGDDEATLISLAAPLHDIGKIGVPDAILLKPASLTPEEFAIIKDHVYHGRRIIGGGTTQLFQLAEQIALYHHERFDGTGYIGLKGEEIPQAARITSVADVFDALTHKRPYKPAWSIVQAVDEIKRGRGTQFDPDVVDAFLWLMRHGKFNGDH